MEASEIQVAHDDNRRREGLRSLERLLAKWERTLADKTSNGYANNNMWTRAQVTLITMGSYRLGVHRPSSDMDILVLAPPNITRHDFFTSFVELLEQETKNPNGDVSHVHAIPQAFTPVIKLQMFDSTLQVDLLFARVTNTKKLLEHRRHRTSPLFSGPNNAERSPFEPAESVTRTEYTIDDTDLCGQDEAGVRSLNGARVSQILLESLPDLDLFRTVLRAVKHWARVKGIYSNVLGFLGGVNWAIMVAYVCIQYPETTNASVMLKRFFYTFSRWNWPNQVALGPIEQQPPVVNATREQCETSIPILPVWNPEVNPRDRLHLMPIITPAYPSMNSSYNVGLAQSRRIQEEIGEAFKILTRSGQPYAKPVSEFLSVQPRDSLIYALFEPSDFFDRHKHYFQLTITATNNADHIEWLRLIESKLRLLIQDMETTEVNVYPFCKFFDHHEYGEQHDHDGTLDITGQTPTLYRTSFFLAFRFAAGTGRVDMRHLTSNFLHTVNSLEGRKAGMDVYFQIVQDNKLPAFVHEQLFCNSLQSQIQDGGSLWSGTNEKSSSASQASTETLSTASTDPSTQRMVRSRSKRFRVEDVETLDEI